MPISSRTPPQPKLPTRARRPYAALGLLWAGLVLALTLAPAAAMPVTPVWELLSFDTAAHAGVFFVLAGLSWFSLRRQTRWPRLARHAGAGALLASVLFGGLIELLQHYMRLGRHGDWTDLLSDAIGAALAVGLATRWATRRRPRQLPAASLLLVGAVLAATGAPAQDISRARRTIGKLAAPELHGRGYVRQGERKAAAYLRGRLHKLKLEPLTPHYTQSFTLDVNTFPGAVRWSVSLGDKGRPLLVARPGRDYIVASASGGGRLIDVPLLRLDTAIFASPLGNPVARQQLLQMPLSQRALLLTARDVTRLPTLPLRLQQHLDSAAAWVRLVPKLTASLASEQRVRIDIEVLSQDKNTRSGSVICSVPAPESARLRTSIVIDARLQRNYPTQNLAAIIRGTAQPDSFLVVSAHYDHLGMMGRKTYFPGANDNASGVALLLELAAHYARSENRPACSVVFLLFGAEEAGLVGSRYFVAHPLVPLKNIKFLVNLDLLGTGEAGATVVNGRVFEAPYRRLLALNEAHRYLPALGARGRAANSDHFPFSEAGVPAFFIYTRGGSAAYHDVNDQPAALSLAGFAGAFGLVRDFLNELGAKK